MKKDHRVLGKELDLFSVHSDLGSGLPVFHPKGAMLRWLIEDHVRHKLLQNGYQFVWTPHVFKADVWKKSGHWDKYKNDMFFTKSEGQIFGIKPMNCPGHIYVYKSQSHSYRELPIRMAEFGTVYRNELSGVLSGLLRVRTITQDDAHVFCTPEQMEQEVIKLVRLSFEIYHDFGFNRKDVSVELSTMPKKHIGTKESWDKATAVLETALRKIRVPFKINKGDGAFYGPKIDLHVKDSSDKNWQLGTIQLDFNMPERFKLYYVGEDNRKHMPIMIHRAILGSTERFMAVLLEHHNGVLPVWLSPVQAKIISMNDTLITYTKRVEEKLRNAGIRVEGDYRTESIQKKVREAELQHIPFIIVIGEKEKAKGTLAVRPLGQKPKFGVKPAEFVRAVNKLVAEMK